VKPELQLALSTIAALLFGVLSGKPFSRSLDQSRATGSTLAHLVASSLFFVMAAIAVSHLLSGLLG
ncbi:MAG: hypothetical protein WBE37_24520, partial [Bryobacteraceae bacterium]